jgi:hypothetical protein
MADLAVGLVRAALGLTIRISADPGRQRPAAAAAMGWQWADSAVRSPSPPGLFRRRPELSAAHTQPPPARHGPRRVRPGGCLDPTGDLRSNALVRPPPRRRSACPCRQDLVRWLGWKKNAHVLRMAAAWPRMARQPAVTRGSMSRSMPRRAFARGHRPRRRAQNRDTTRDQHVTHTVSSSDGQASSPVLFHQATSLPCKLSSNSASGPLTN